MRKKTKEEEIKELEQIIKRVESEGNKAYIDFQKAIVNEIKQIKIKKKIKNNIDNF